MATAMAKRGKLKERWIWVGMVARELGQVGGNLRASPRCGWTHLCQTSCFLVIEYDLEQKGVEMCRRPSSADESLGEMGEEVCKIDSGGLREGKKFAGC